MTDRYDEWRDFYAEKVRSWMSLEELRAECGKLVTADSPSPEVLLIHAMHALEECVQRDEAMREEVAEWKRVSAAQAELHGEAEERAEQLAEDDAWCAEWPKGADFTMEVEEFRLYATEVMGLPAPANRAGLIEPTRSFAIAAQQQDKLDAERWRYIRRKLCLTGNGDGTCAMQAINLPAAIQGWPEPGQVAEFCDAAIDAAMQRTSGPDRRDGQPARHNG